MSTERPVWAPDGIDLARPNAARVYDYLLGGAANFEKDREFADDLVRIAPEAATAARHNRAFLRRAVTFCVDNGIHQFLDIGSGIPTVGNVHEIARRADPAARVLYVDREPVAVTHTELMLDGDERAGVVQANLLEPDAILSSPAAVRLLDLDRPIAVLMLAVLHFVPDRARPHAAVARYVDAMAPGSYLVLSHSAFSATTQNARAWQHFQKTGTPGQSRTREQLAGFLAGTELVEPGVVWLPEWHPDTPADAADPERSKTYCCAGRKP